MCIKKNYFQLLIFRLTFTPNVMRESLLLRNLSISKYVGMSVCMFVCMYVCMLVSTFQATILKLGFSFFPYKILSGVGIEKDRILTKSVAF